MSTEPDSEGLQERLQECERKQLAQEERIGQLQAELDAARRSFNESNARFEAVYNHHYQLTGLLNTDGRLLMANKTALEFAGLQEKDVLGKDFSETPWWTHSPREQLKLKLAMDEAKTGKSVQIETSHKTADGEQRIIEFRISPVFDESGKVIYLVPEGYDITEHRRAQEALQESEEQLRHSQKMEAVGQLAGGVAHDFNNLLQGILGFCTIAMEEADPASHVYDDLEQIRKAGNRATRLVQQLLAFSRKQVLKIETVNLNEVIQDFAKMIRRVIGEHIDLSLDFATGLKSVRADRGQLEQILMNLCVNARDAMPNGGQLTVSTENVEVDADFCHQHTGATPGTYAKLSVRDSGTGMDETTRSRVFEPFFTTKGERQGTGLGLSTVYGIVRQHSGVITLESREGAGSNFMIFLPTSQAAVQVSPESLPDDKRGGSERILLAEDDATVRKLARKLLERAGYTVMAAASGTEAIQLFEDHERQFDLAFLDVVMPGQGGRAVYDHIVNVAPDIPVLFSSGYSAGGVHTNFILEEGIALIQKPYTHDGLLNEVRRLLDE